MYFVLALWLILFPEFGKPDFTEDFRQKGDFERLGIEPNASPTETKTAYHTLLKKFHPDRGGSTEIAAMLNEAYDNIKKGNAQHSRALSGRKPKAPPRREPPPSFKAPAWSEGASEFEIAARTERDRLFMQARAAFLKNNGLPVNALNFRLLEHWQNYHQEEMPIKILKAAGEIRTMASYQILKSLIASLPAGSDAFEALEKIFAQENPVKNSLLEKFVRLDRSNRVNKSAIDTLFNLHREEELSALKKLDETFNARTFAIFLEIQNRPGAKVFWELLRLGSPDLLRSPYSDALLKLDAENAAHLLEKIALSPKAGANALLEPGFWSKLRSCNTLYSRIYSKKPVVDKSI